METLEEFKKKHNNSTGKGNRKMAVTGSVGVYHIYKWIRKNGWYNIGRPLKEHEFYTIIRSINNLLSDEIAKGNTVRFPANMGTLELRKYEAGVCFVDGKLHINYPVDWGETWKLWYQDKEAFDKKCLLRFERPFTYKMCYCKGKAKYRNKQFYQFTLHQKLKRRLARNIKNGITDTIYG